MTQSHDQPTPAPLPTCLTCGEPVEAICLMHPRRAPSPLLHGSIPSCEHQHPYDEAAVEPAPPVEPETFAQLGAQVFNDRPSPAPSSAEGEPHPCISSNEPERGGTVPETVLDFPFEAGKTVCIDSCIADTIQALWAAGHHTYSSCCGHGTARPSVVVERTPAPEIIEMLEKDGRPWIVYAWVLTEMNAK